MENNTPITNTPSAIPPSSGNGKKILAITTLIVLVTGGGFFLTKNGVGLKGAMITGVPASNNTSSKCSDIDKSAATALPRDPARENKYILRAAHDDNSDLQVGSTTWESKDLPAGVTLEPGFFDNEMEVKGAITCPFVFNVTVTDIKSKEKAEKAYYIDEAAAQTAEKILGLASNSSINTATLEAKNSLTSTYTADNLTTLGRAKSELTRNIVTTSPTFADKNAEFKVGMSVLVPDLLSAQSGTTCSPVKNAKGMGYNPSGEDCLDWYVGTIRKIEKPSSISNGGFTVELKIPTGPLGSSTKVPYGFAAFLTVHPEAKDVTSGNQVIIFSPVDGHYYAATVQSANKDGTISVTTNDNHESFTLKSSHIYVQGTNFSSLPVDIKQLEKNWY